MFDIDKIFIASLNYKIRKNESGKYYSEDLTMSEKHKTQNQLLNYYLTLLCDDEGMHIANRSIDNDTDLVLDVLDDLESNISDDDNKYVEPYDFYTLSKHTNTKLNFLTGKTGIAPFALNNNSLILTTLYGVEFSESSFMNSLGRRSLHEVQDMDGQSIMSWISALINAHVDIAKDPYISRLNVNEMTYNLTNLLIRTGYGKRTFYLLKQPAMLAMSDKYRQAQGKFLLDPTRSLWDIKNNAKKDAVVELVGQNIFDDVSKRLNVKDNNPLGSIENYAKELLEGDVLHKIARGDIELNSQTTYLIGKSKFTPKEIQVLVYYLDKALEKPAQAISDLVKYSKIDTKKQGKNVSEQLAYARGVAKTFGDDVLLQDMFGNADIRTITDSANDDLNSKALRIKQLETQIENSTDENEIQELKDELDTLSAEFSDQYQKVASEEVSQDSEFDPVGIKRMYEQSFIKDKTRAAIFEFMSVMDGQVFEATSGFQNLLNRFCTYFNKYDASSISEITRAISAKLKADAINEYAERMGIDIRDLVSGSNTIYDRLNSIKIRLKSDPEYSDIKNNALLTLLIADKNWTYDWRMHPGHVMDRFLNLKFIRLFDALDKSNSKTDYIIQAWDDLLHNGKHPEIQEFARDLCVYAYVTSGDQGGRTKLFNYVPNSFREESGYVERVEQMLLDMKDDPDYGTKMFTDSFIDDVVLNNQDSSTFVKTIDSSNKNWKEGMVKWKEIKAVSNINIGTVDNPVTYIPSYPLLITTDSSTPMLITQTSPFIKIVHQTSQFNDNSSRAESIYKLIAFVPTEKGFGIPVYVKTNSKGYHIKGGYDFYEYGKSVIDAEYTPNIYSIEKSIRSVLNDSEAYNKWSVRFEALYGKGFTETAELIAQTQQRPIGYNLTQNILSSEELKLAKKIKEQCKNS